MTKRNLYIILFILCILPVIIFESSSAYEPAGGPDNSVFSSYRKDNFQNYSPGPFVILVSSGYLFLFAAGLVNLAIFLTRKLHARPAVSLEDAPKKELPLPEEKTAELIFLIGLLMLFTYLAPGIIPYLAIKIKPVYIILAGNLLLHFGSAFLILSYIRPSFFKLLPDKKEAGFALRAYTAVIPIIALSLFLNLFFFRIFGIEMRPSPVSRILPLIDTNLSLFLFIFQVILTAPLAEELVFRGLFYKLLRTKYSFAASAVILSLFFSLIHRAPMGAIGLFTISMALCYIYEKTQSIAPAFIFHSLHNTITVLFFLGIKF